MNELVYLHSFSHNYSSDGKILLFPHYLTPITSIFQPLALQEEAFFLCVPTMLRVSPRVSPRDTCPIFTYITGYGWKITFSPLLTFPPVGTRVQAAVAWGPPFPVPWSPAPGAMRWMCIHLTSTLGKDNYEKVQLRSLLLPLGVSRLQSMGPQGWAPDVLPRRAPHSKNLSAVKTSALISQTSQNPGSRKRRRVAFTWFPQIFQDAHEPAPKPLPHRPRAPT